MGWKNARTGTHTVQLFSSGVGYYHWREIDSAGNAIGDSGTVCAGSKKTALANIGLFLDCRRPQKRPVPAAGASPASGTCRVVVYIKASDTDAVLDLVRRIEREKIVSAVNYHIPPARRSDGVRQKATGHATPKK